MNIVTQEQYNKVQVEFINKHPIVSVNTSLMRDNAYCKTYDAYDGAAMWECRRLVHEIVKVKVKGVTTKVRVELWENECWSTEFKSMYFYEKA